MRLEAAYGACRSRLLPGPGGPNLSCVHFGVVILPELGWAESNAALAQGRGAWFRARLDLRPPGLALVPRPCLVQRHPDPHGRRRHDRAAPGRHLVASPNFRHPLPFVKDLIALDDISGGRVIAGIGAGGTGFDATALGQAAWSQAERAERFAEFVTLTDLLLRQPELTWEGRYYSVDEARTYPGCAQQPRIPLAIAAHGPKGMRLAAQHGDFWVTLGGGSTDLFGPAEGAGAVAAQVEQVDEACREAGRDPSSLRRLVLTGVPLDPGLASPEEFRDTVGRYEEVGVTDFVVHWPRPCEPYAGDLAMFEHIFEVVQ